MYAQEFAHLQFCLFRTCLPTKDLPRAFGALMEASISSGGFGDAAGQAPRNPRLPNPRFPPCLRRAWQGADSHFGLEAASPRARLQLHAEIPAMTVQKRGFKHDELIPTHSSLTIKEERGGPSGPGSLARAAKASRALCRLAVDARQENRGRAPAPAAAMEKSNHPTDLWYCFCRRLLHTEANRAG